MILDRESRQATLDIIGTARESESNHNLKTITKRSSILRKFQKSIQSSMEELTLTRLSDAQNSNQSRNDPKSILKDSNSELAF